MSAPRSYLFVPASRPDRIAKALAAGADAVIVDLEDGVAADDKEQARAGLATVEVPPHRAVHLRVNGRGTEHHLDDLDAVPRLPWVVAVVVPKVESAADIAAVRAALRDDVAVVALVETARGVVAADEIAAGDTTRIMFGSVDYLADLGATSGPEVLAYPRARLAVASRAAGLPGPVDGPTLATHDELAVRDDAVAARAFGFTAKLCIHPAQVVVVNAVFTPSDEQRRWARGVLDAATSQRGAFTFEGAMVDEPVLARARRLLADEEDR